jgi:hypothetical protein
MFGLDGGTNLLATVCCRQGIDSLRLIMRDRNGDIVTIPGDTRLVATTLQVELIVKLQTVLPLNNTRAFRENRRR